MLRIFSSNRSLTITEKGLKLELSNLVQTVHSGHPGLSSILGPKGQKSRYSVSVISKPCMWQDIEKEIKTAY